jgi:hypothetical protein
MKRFVARFDSLVSGVLSGFDRLVLRGCLMPLMRPRGMHDFLGKADIRLLDFGKYAEKTSERVKIAALSAAREANRPVQYLTSSRGSKEEMARDVLAKRPIGDGIICAFSVVEPCRSFEYHKSACEGERGLRLINRKCLHVYQYRNHPTFGFMNARIQTWFPFNVQICLNGREWLGRQLTEAGIGFRRYDNCFPAVDDLAGATALLESQLATEWPTMLTEIAQWLNPLHQEIFAAFPMDYYWSAYQTEWATDVMFHDPARLASLYPALVIHAMRHFQSADVMRFLAQKSPGNFIGEIVTDFKDRVEGVRVKHWVNGNSVKMYDKGGSVLRIETTMANPKDFKVLRPRRDEPDGALVWQPLRKGVADLHRRAEVSQRSNDRYLDALSVVDDSTPLGTLLDAVAAPTTWHDKRVRALRVGHPDDVALLAAISRGEFVTAGFRNRDIRLHLHPKTANADSSEVRRVAARVGRQLRMLRAHGILQKIPKTHRYQLTAKGQALTAVLTAVRSATLKQLLREAA